MTRRPTSLRPLLGSVAALACLTSCGSSGHTDDDSAVWGFAPGRRLTAKTTQFDSVIARTGCSSGKARST